jgi:hypothetical protein
VNPPLHPPRITDRIENMADGQPRWRSAELTHWLRRLPARSRYLAPVLVFLALGDVIAGARGLVIAAALVVVGTPVIGFTYNQMILTNKGRRLATTVDEVRALKESDAAAFAQPLAVVLGRLPTEQMSPAEQSDIARTPLPRAVGQDLELWRPAPVEVWHGDTPRPEYIRSARPNFWQSLTCDEQQALQASGQTGIFEPGMILCRQSEPAKFVFLIHSGLAKVYVSQQGGSRVIAVRGAGDIIGERSALRVRSRSATVVAIEQVRTLIITTTNFAAFLQAHPRVLDVLEQRVYDRLTEDPHPVFGRDSQEAEPWRGHNCSIFLSDIVAFGWHDRNDVDRKVVRDEMYANLRDAFEGSDVPWWSCHREDRGDGALIVIPPNIPTRAVVYPLLDLLASALKRHNRQTTKATRMQLRVALNVGPVISDPRGVSGEAIIRAARLIDAPMLKKELARSAADLGVIVSTFIYDSVIKHAPGQVDSAQYRQLRFRVKESSLTAWMYLAGG